MTNEEKSKLIADKIKQSNKVHYMYIDSTIYMVKNAAMEMAEWKDQQFKEYLEKKKDDYMRLRDSWLPDTLDFCYYDSKVTLIEEIINELFKEE